MRYARASSVQYSGWEFSPQAFEHLDKPMVFEKIKNDLLDFKAVGGGTIVDCSGIGIGRDIQFYVDLARESGMNIVACTGFWAEQKILTYFAVRDIDYLTELFVREVTVGMGTTNVKAGIIKVGNSRDRMSEIEERTFRAAARAAKKTGVLVTTHGAPMAERQAEIFLEEGADPTRVVIGHLDGKPDIDIERDKRLGRLGFSLGYDRVGILPGLVADVLRHSGRATG